MKKLIVAIILLVTLSLFIPSNLFSWGFYAHQKANRMAVFCLPPEMIGFYKKNIEYISKHAVDPDKRRYAVKEEAARHYIDADRYGLSPFDSLPHRWEDAVKKYSEDTLKAHGILPWYINKMYYRLVDAFKEENINNILKISADMGHYIADAHVPLHTTRNYNGQLTGQKGIHGLWESSIPELKEPGYDYLLGKAVYLNSPIETAWNMVKESFSEKDSVLEFEKKLSNSFDSDKKYTHQTKGKKTIKTYSKEYIEAYNAMLNGMVERRLRATVQLIACYWYTAWVNAGQPDLEKLLIKNSSTTELEKESEQDTLKVPKANLIGHEE